MDELLPFPESSSCKGVVACHYLKAFFGRTSCFPNEMEHLQAKQSKPEVLWGQQLSRPLLLRAPQPGTQEAQIVFGALTAQDSAWKQVSTGQSSAPTSTAWVPTSLALRCGRGNNTQVSRAVVPQGADHCPALLAQTFLHEKKPTLERKMSIFSSAYWPGGCLLGRNICSSPLACCSFCC